MSDKNKRIDAKSLTVEDATTFTEKELAALNDYIRKGGQNIAPQKAANFLALYLEGRSVNDIAARFPEWPKGAILYARYAYRWDEEKERYWEELVEQTKERLSTVQAQSAKYLMDQLAVAHKEFSREMEAYFSNPTPENLPKGRILNLKQYRDAIAALKELLALNPTTRELPESAVTVNVNTTGGTVQITDGRTINITPEEHREGLKALRALKAGDQQVKEEATEEKNEEKADH